MATYYASPDAAGGGSGSQASPWTLAEAESNLTTGDTLYLMYGTDGQFYDSLSLSSIDNVTIKPDPDNDPGQRVRLRGDTLIGTGSGVWTLVAAATAGGSNDVYYAEIGNGFSISTVHWQFGNSETDVAPSESWQTTRKAATLAAASTLANCSNTRGSWFYDTTATPDRLYVCAPSSGDLDVSATAERYSYSLDGLNVDAITLNGCDDCIIEDIDFANWTTAGPTQGGWSVKFTGGCNRCRMSGGTTINAGRHVCGVVGASQACIFENHTAIGMHMDGGETTVNPYVIAATSGAGAITSGTIRNCVFHAHNLLRPGGTTPIVATKVIWQFLQTHGDGATDTLSGLDLIGNRMIGYAITDSRTDEAIYISVKDVAAFTDDGTFENFPVRVTGAGTTPVLRGIPGLTGFANANNSTIDGEHVAFRRCFFKIDGWGAAVAANSVHCFGLEGGNHHRFDECVFWIDVEGVTENRVPLFYVEDASSLYEFNRCTVYADGVATGVFSITFFNANKTDKSYKMRQCLFSASEAHTFGKMNTGTGTTVWDVEDCWYHNFNAQFLDTVGADTTIDTKTEWTSVIDPDGVYDTDPEFVAASSADLSLTVDGNAWDTRKVLAAGAGTRGIDDGSYSGAYGAFQASGNNPRGRNFRARAGGYVR